MPAPKLWIRLIAALTPNCDAVTRLTSEGRERPLTTLEKMRLRSHYRICEWCRRYERQLTEIGTLAKNVSSPRGESKERLSDERRSQLRNLLEQ